MTNRIDGSAIAAEVAVNNFADERLTRRLEKTLVSLARDPAASLPCALTSAELEGAYRFFSNPIVTPESILGPHFAATRARCATAPRVRIVHDTTQFSYKRQTRRDGFDDAFGFKNFYGHFSMAVASDASRMPLGLVALKTWPRGEKGVTHSAWLSQIEASATLLGDSARATIHVCDRGADDYDLFARLIATGHRFVIRAGRDRWTNSGLDDTPEKLRSVLAKVEHEADREAKLNPRGRHARAAFRKIHPPRETRTATLHIAATRLQIVRPANYREGNDRGRVSPTIDLNVVRVWEPSPPAGETPIEWILFTTEPIDTSANVLAIVDDYRARWMIEEYFKALKTGCAFERRQLHDYESRLNALAVFAPLAFHVLLLRTMARLQPQSAATTVVSDDHLEVLRALGRRPLPPSPTARDALLAIAALGGHIKYAPDPGWLTIARGYEKLEVLTAGWRAGKLQRHRDQR